MGRLFASLTLFVICVAPAFAAESIVDTTVGSPRARAHTGLILGLNDPVPAVFGASIAYNLFDFARLQAGIGRFNSDYNYGGTTITTKSFTYAFGARFFLPGWQLTPMAGVSWATIQTEGFPNDDHHTSVSVGVDWQMPMGLDLAAGYNQSFEKAIGGLPFVNVGWFFSVL